MITTNFDNNKKKCVQLRVDVLILVNFMIIFWHLVSTLQTSKKYTWNKKNDEINDILKINFCAILGYFDLYNYLFFFKYTKLNIYKLI